VFIQQVIADRDPLVALGVEELTRTIAQAQFERCSAQAGLPPGVDRTQFYFAPGLIGKSAPVRQRRSPPGGTLRFVLWYVDEETTLLLAGIHQTKKIPNFPTPAIATPMKWPEV
tara:strand:- start:710 stop:1051 length:342 start_codon:yes stop_codon:yes gene_type:complete